MNLSLSRYSSQPLSHALTLSLSFSLSALAANVDGVGL